MNLSVGILGYGSFGAFLHVLINRFAPDIEVSVYSPEKSPDGLLFKSLEHTLQSDIIFLAVPISAYESTLIESKPHLSPQAILVDIATVKVHTVKTIRNVIPAACYLAIHPMFGPSSYAKRGGDVNGFRIAVTDTNLKQDKLRELKKWASDLGFVIVELTAQEHDKKLAETLFLTHYIGQIVTWGNFARTDIDTASFGYLMDAVDSVRHDAALFSDVSRYNPYCKEVVERFDECERAVKAHYLDSPSKPSERD